MFLRSFVPLPIVYSYHFTVWIESTPICLRGTVPEPGSICPKDLPFMAYAIFALAILLASTPLYYNAVGSLNTTPNNPSFQGELASSVLQGKVISFENITGGEGGLCIVMITPNGPIPEGPCGPVYGNGFSQFAEFVVRDQVSWEEVWARAFCGDSGPCQSSPPNVDFLSTTVVAVFLGWTGSGYAVRISQVDRKGHTLIVHVEITLPGTGCSYPAWLTYPFDIVDIPRTRLRVLFETETITSVCR